MRQSLRQGLKNRRARVGITSREITRSLTSVFKFRSKVRVGLGVGGVIGLGVALGVALGVVLGIGSISKGFAQPIKWETRSAEGVVTLWRAQGDALAARHAVRQVIEGDLTKRHIFTTELTHPPSGCALELTWERRAQADSAPYNLNSSLSMTTPLSSRALSKWTRRAPLEWGKSPLKPRALRAQVSFEGEMITLSAVKWWGCGWGDRLKPDTASDTDSTGGDARDPSRPSRAQPKRFTLPHGAKSTRARAPSALQRSAEEPEASLKATRKGQRIRLQSQRWAFALDLTVNADSPYTPSLLASGGWSWTTKRMGDSNDEPQPLLITVTLIHRSPKLNSVKGGAPKLKGVDALSEWQTLLEFLSTDRGVIDGLGERGTSRQWAGLALLATLPLDQLKETSTAWCEAVILGALSELPAWPHPFRAYKRPLKPLDGRLFLPIALERYLLDHPQGKTRASELLRSKSAGQMVAGLVRKQLQDLVGRGSFFANRPSKRHLISVDPHPERVDPNGTAPLHHSFVESVALMPRALSAIARVLSDRELSALISAPVGLELRASKVHDRWRERARSFFGRTLEVYEARSRVASWGRFFELPDPETPSLSIRHNIRYYESRLSAKPLLSGDSALDMLWGQHDEHDIKPLFNLARPFPAGLMGDRGVIRAHGLPFIAEVSPQKLDVVTPSATSSALWMLALDRQLKRRWPYKLKSKLEDTRATLWKRLTEPDLPGRSAWLNTRLTALAGLLSALSAPPPIEAGTNVDPRELR